MRRRPRTRGGAGWRPPLLVRLLAAGAVAVVGRPSLWCVAIRQVVRLGTQQGRLALPPVAYLRWRLETAYGCREGTPAAEDLAAWLDWCKRLDRAAR